MNIAFIHPSFPGREGTGTTYTANQLIIGLINEGHHLTVYCQNRPSDKPIQFNNLKYVVLEEPSSFHHPNIFPNNQIEDRLDEFEDYDLVHSYPMHFLPAMAKISRHTSTKTIVTLNGYRPVCPKNDLRYEDEKPCRHNGIRRCTSCIATTSSKNYVDTPIRSFLGRLGNLKLVHEAKKEWEHIDQYHAQSPHMKSIFSQFDLSKEEISIIPNIVDNRFLVDHESDFTEPYKLLYVGDLHRRKGVMKIPEIVNHLRKAQFDFKFTVIGDGSLYDQLSDKIYNYEISNLISLEGRRPYEQLPEVYATHDLFVYPGVWEEPFARVFLEALATGTPVVASNIGSINEILGGAGVVTNGDPRSLATSIETIILQGDLERMSTKASKQVQRYTPDNIIPEMISLYNTLCR